jgi:FkbM family methyltransferase
MLLSLIRNVTDSYYIKGLYRGLWHFRHLFKAASDIYSVDGNYLMYLDSDHYYQWMMASTNYYGFGIRKLMRDFLRKGDIFIDVGGNIGYLSLLASMIVAESGRVVAFEPDPRAAEVFQKNTALNNVHNILLIEKACSDQDGSVLFNMASHLGWSTALTDTKTLKIEKQINVEQCTLDGETGKLFGNESPRLIKIDVEGYEPYVLKGAHAIIDKNETAFIIEINSERLGSCNHSILDLCGAFDRTKYRIYWIDEKRYLINSLNQVELVEILKTEDFLYQNGDIFVVPVKFMSELQY